MADRSAGSSRNAALHSILSALLSSLCGVEAAAVISYDGLPIASALPASTDESRVAAMSAALLSLGERATEGLGRGALAEVFIEGKHGTVFLVSCEEAAVLVAVRREGRQDRAGALRGPSLRGPGRRRAAARCRPADRRGGHPDAS